MADSVLQFLNDYDEGNVDEQTSSVTPREPVTTVQSQDNTTDPLEFLNKYDAAQGTETQVQAIEEEAEPELAPEDDPRYVEYYKKRLLPVEETYNGIEIKPYAEVKVEKQMTSNFGRTKQTLEDLSEDKAYVDNQVEETGALDLVLSERGLTIEDINVPTSELAKLTADEFLKYMDQKNAVEKEANKLYYEEFIQEDLLAALDNQPQMKQFLEATGSTGYNMLMGLGNGVQLTADVYTDVVQEALEFGEENGIGFETIKTILSFGGKFDVGDTPQEVAEEIADNTGAFLEFSETLPFMGALRPARAGALRKALKDKETLERANRYNPKGAELATMETAEQARIAAREAAEANRDISNQLIREFEEKTGKTVSKQQGDNLVLDPELAREAGRETAREITERDGDLFDLALGSDVITSPILSPDKFDGIVAIASDLKRAYPESFNNNKTVIDNLFELTVNKNLIAGQELIDSLNKYGLSFEDYVLTVVGSGSEAGKALQKIGQIKRVKPKNIADADEAAKKAREAGDFRKGVMRVENIRRGLLVSQIATAARNLTSGAIRAPMEGLGNVMDSAIYAAQKKGPVSGALELFSGDNWRGSFSSMKYMFSRPDVAKGYTDLILGAPELAKQFDNMFNNINEIQKLTGRGTGTKLDKVMSGMEDVVDVLNTPNRWQEYLIRRGQFFGELERLTKREYGIDLIDALNEGKLKDLLNDATTIRPEGSPSFISLVDDAVTKALDVTYAKQPEIPAFRSASSIITRYGLTTIMPFPRFMFNSMELIGQYAGGASIPLTRKMASIVMKDQRGPLTSKDRQRITRNLMGMAAVGAAYWYRSSENAPPEYNQVAVGTDAQMDTTPTYPMAHFLYLGEATKRLQDGTFDDWFDSQEFVELFTGSNLRTGVGNSILEEVAQMADATDLTAGAATGRALGRTLGNYLSTWAVPFGQIIDAERAAGIRGAEYKDVASDPTLDFGTTFKKELIRPLKQRGIGVSAEEEAAAPRAEYPFYPEGRERIRPESKFIGATITNRASEEGEYLMRYGFDWRDFGSRSKVPSIKRFETKHINNLIPTIVESARKLEEEYVKKYEEGSDLLRKEFTVEEYVSNKVRPYIDKQIKTFKAKIREGSISEGDDYTRALQTYTRVPSNFRKLATTDFVDRYDRVPDPQSAEDLQRLIAIAKAYRETY